MNEKDLCALLAETAIRNAEDPNTACGALALALAQIMALTDQPPTVGIMYLCDAYHGVQSQLRTDPHWAREGEGSES